jgi:pimeloyl-ACP methyl ester carboxylesterase
MKALLTAEIDTLKFKGTYYPAQRLENGDTLNTLLFCLPGGGASAEYFDLSPTHSFAQIMTKNGYDVLTMDHPGTATNPLPHDHPFLTPYQAVDLISRCYENFTAQIDMNQTKAIGIGHSMGGMVITILQARHQVFQSIGLLGSSAGGLEWGLSKEEKPYIDNQPSFLDNLERLTLNKFKTAFPPSTGGPSGKSITFGGETPELTQRLKDISCALYAAGGMMSMTRGSFKREVDAIDIPIFFAFGDHDIGIPPQDAPKDYTGTSETNLMILNETGHNHFAFSSINTLCQKLHYWLSSLD